MQKSIFVEINAKLVNCLVSNVKENHVLTVNFGDSVEVIQLSPQYDIFDMIVDPVQNWLNS